MNLQGSSIVCQLISKGYFAQAKDKINNLKMNLNEIDQNGRTILIMCSFIDEPSWSMSLAQFVIELGASLSVKDYPNQMNILHYCCILEQEQLLEMLLESVDFDINNGDSLGNSPLIYAITTNNTAMIDSLLKFYKRYKINVDKTNLKGVNALIQACLNGNISLMKELLEMGANESIKDCNGKSAQQYKEEAISKSDLIGQYNENRRQSRMIRFDDIELIMKLQQENIHLQQDSYKIVKDIDHNIERLKALKIKLKRIKRNKIDYAYVSRFCRSAGEHNKDVELKHDLNITKIRPKTAILNTQDLKEKGDWYSIVGPLYVTLEQQHTPSFRVPNKNDNITQSYEMFSDRYRNHLRRLSRSIGSISRKNSINGRLLSNEEGSDNVCVAPRSKKRSEAITSAKNLLRNISRFGIRSSSNSLNNTS